MVSGQQSAVSGRRSRIGSGRQTPVALGDRALAAVGKVSAIGDHRALAAVGKPCRFGRSRIGSGS